MPAFIHSFIDSWSFIHAQSFIHSCLNSFIQLWSSFTHLCLCLLFIHSQMPVLIPSSMAIHSPCLCSLSIHSQMPAFIHPLMPVFIHSLKSSPLLYGFHRSKSYVPVITNPALLGPWQVPPEFRERRGRKVVTLSVLQLNPLPSRFPPFDESPGAATKS